MKIKQKRFNVIAGIKKMAEMGSQLHQKELEAYLKKRGLASFEELEMYIPVLTNPKPEIVNTNPVFEDSVDDITKKLLTEFWFSDLFRSKTPPKFGGVQLFKNEQGKFTIIFSDDPFELNAYVVLSTQWRKPRCSVIEWNDGIDDCSGGAFNHHGEYVTSIAIEAIDLFCWGTPHGKKKKKKAEIVKCLTNLLNYVESESEAEIILQAALNDLEENELEIFQ